MRSMIFALVVSLQTLTAAVLGSQPAAKESAADKPPAPRDVAGVAAAVIEPLKPGTRIDPAALPEHVHLVFRSRPKLTSGPAEKVKPSIRKTLETYTTLVVVHTEPDPAAPGRFRRGTYHIGIGKPGDGTAGDNGDLVITSDTAAAHGVKLSGFETKVFTAREQELATVGTPGASPTMAMYDFSMMFLRDGKRVPIVVRYMALVDPASGAVDTAYWVLDAPPEGRKFFGDELRVLPRNHVMDWEMHVDGSQLTFGLPNGDAFTSTKLPTGKALPIPADFKTASTARSYDAAAAASLEKQVRAIVGGAAK
jgi:hypothetical protein